MFIVFNFKIKGYFLLEIGKLKAFLFCFFLLLINGGSCGLYLHIISYI